MPDWTLRKFLEGLGLDVDQMLSMPNSTVEEPGGFHVYIDGELPFKRTPLRLKQGDVEVEILVTKQEVE